MANDDAQAQPKRGPEHDLLVVFLGDWSAEGISYGGTDQSGADPRANGESWRSTHSGRWHTGEFILVQDERATVGGAPFDTLSVMGVKEGGRDYFARSFENHGFTREYAVTVSGDDWTLTGDTERATIRFSDDGRTQTIAWEWKVDGKWLPLCDRVATRR